MDKMITITMPMQLAQEVINVLGEVPARLSAKVLLAFLEAANKAEELKTPKSGKKAA